MIENECCAISEFIHGITIKCMLYTSCGGVVALRGINSIWLGSANLKMLFDRQKESEGGRKKEVFTLSNVLSSNSDSIYKVIITYDNHTYYIQIYVQMLKL